MRESVWHTLPTTPITDHFDRALAELITTTRARNMRTRQEIDQVVIDAENKYVAEHSSDK